MTRVVDLATFGRWARQNIVVLVTALAAVISCIFVPPDHKYWDYFDARTLVCLFCMMAVIAALYRAGFITFLAGQAIHYFRSRRRLIGGLVGLTFVAAMFVSNDMALLTMLPLTFVALEATGNTRLLAFSFVMETAAANLGGMILPFGSPQNLFLFSFYEIPAVEFIGVMALPFVVSMILITAICRFVSDESIEVVNIDRPELETRPIVWYLVLFAVTIAIVFRVFPVWFGLVVPVVMLFLDRRALRDLDWGLMLTFVGFFVFTGNLARIESVDGFLTGGLESNVLLWSALTSQIISNVPTAILFAQFTGSYRELLVGVNIGGVGTIVASLANLIALTKYREYVPGDTRHFMAVFSAVNLGLLMALLAVTMSAVWLGLV